MRSSLSVKIALVLTKNILFKLITKMMIMQYLLYEKNITIPGYNTDSRFQKNLRSLMFLLEDNPLFFNQLIHDVKNIEQVVQMSFDVSRVFYDEDDGTITVSENIGLDSDKCSPFVTTQVDLLSILERWRNVYLQQKNFILVTLDEDNYVDFVIFDTQQEVDHFLKTHYRGDGNGRR